MAHGCTYCTDDFHCEKFTDEKHTSWCYGKDYPCKDRRISNADRIRSMSDEELADFITDDMCGLICGDPLACEGQCKQKMLDWLKGEAQNG